MSNSAPITSASTGGQVSSDGLRGAQQHVSVAGVELRYGFVFVGVNAAANAGVPPDKAGLAAALVNTST
jgi:hypothetical protein